MGKSSGSLVVVRVLSFMARGQNFPSRLRGVWEREIWHHKARPDRWWWYPLLSLPSSSIYFATKYIQISFLTFLINHTFVSRISLSHKRLFIRRVQGLCDGFHIGWHPTLHWCHAHGAHTQSPATGSHEKSPARWRCPSNPVQHGIRQPGNNQTVNITNGIIIMIDR